MVIQYQTQEDRSITSLMTSQPLQKRVYQIGSELLQQNRLVISPTVSLGNHINTTVTSFSNRS
jgi:hypothetical protein